VAGILSSRKAVVAADGGEVALYFPGFTPLGAEPAEQPAVPPPSVNSSEDQISACGEWKN
jgi:hypothetical protein